MTAAKNCPRCGAALPDSTSRLCPACLLAVAVDPDLTTTQTMTGEGPAGFGTLRPAQLTPGQIFGAYRVERLLGQGGMGQVYEAEQLEHGRRVALKVISRDLTGPSDRERFLREGQLAASVTHPHVVYIFGSEEIAGAPVITMELLPGGTLRDRVDRDGPLAPAAAVDAILQVIWGLDAAHHAGILHRDVKPSNCFVDLDGTVKIGDFGLSISTLGRYEDSLSAPGSIQGTPQFAAPEQLAGEPLDMRADIYAVGGTLYYLLTGRAPFDAPNLGALLQQVATQQAAFPKELRIGRRLAAVVLRCLDKRPAGRPASYRELHEALAPFGSAAPQLAGALSRICAFYVDAYIVGLLGAVVRELAGLDWPPRYTSWSIGTTLVLFAYGMGMPLAYFAVLEGIFSRSAGKALFGLQVTSVDGTPAPKLAVTARAALFMACVFGIRLVVAALPLGLSVALASFGLWAPAVLVFLTARRQNGLAGLHDLVTRTRVTVRRRAGIIERPVSRPESAEPAATGWGRRYGPFGVLDPVTTEGQAAVSRGWDFALRRHVWIVEAPPGSHLAPVTRRLVSRPTRLRWLAGREEADRTWQVFEAPAGEPFLDAIDPRPSWQVVRGWVASLAGELQVARTEGTLPPRGFDRLWVTPQGSVILTDFPVATDHVTGQQARPDRAAGAGGFLLAVAGTGVSGIPGEVPEISPRGGPPLPIGDRSALEAFAAVGEPGATDLADLQEALAVPRPPVARWTRLVVPAVLAMVIAATVIGTGGQRRRTALMEPQWALFNGMIEIERLHRRGIPPSHPDREALEIYVAARYRGNVASAAYIHPRLVWISRDVESRRAGVADADLVSAAGRLGRQRLDRLNREPPETPPHMVVSARVWLLAIFGAIAVLAALLFRAGPILRSQKIAIVDNEGVEVSRPRAAWRALIAWSPILVHWMLPPPLGEGDAMWFMAVAALLTVAVAGVWSAAMRPERALHDRLAGTWLVPR